MICIRITILEELESCYFPTLIQLCTVSLLLPLSLHWNIMYGALGYSPLYAIPDFKKNQLYEPRIPAPGPVHRLVWHRKLFDTPSSGLRRKNSTATIHYTSLRSHRGGLECHSSIMVEILLKGRIKWHMQCVDALIKLQPRWHCCKISGRTRPVPDLPAPSQLVYVIMNMTASGMRARRSRKLREISCLCMDGIPWRKATKMTG